jgi:sugar lactone lactonase YvrE
MSNHRVFIHLGSGQGTLDGLAVDFKENVSKTIYRDGKVSRISPEQEVVGVVKLPTGCTTGRCVSDEALFITSGADPYPEPSEFPLSTDLGVSVC